jgi:hypothetical protein
MIVFPRKQGLLERERKNQSSLGAGRRRAGKALVGCSFHPFFQPPKRIGERLGEEEEAEELDVLMADHL